MIKAAGGTGKSTLFTKLHAACRAKGHLIQVVASTTLAATMYENANTAHVSQRILRSISD
jgi:molybdopterin-guanine dinucleotide biosynthesis protein